MSVKIRKRYLPFGKPNFSDKEVEAVGRALRSGWIGMGPETIGFERELARHLGAAHVVTVNSCTSALFLSLAVLGVGEGDEVICPSLTWCSSANAALYLGAQPVFCDVDPKTLCATPEDVVRCLSRRTKAVVVVHFGGYAMDVAALRRALPKRVAIVEDAAHALGARFPDGRPVGSSRNLTCFSFYANKNLSTGEGGAIALHDAKLAARLGSLRQHALPTDAWKRYTHPKTTLAPGGLSELGYKMNFTDLNAVIGRVQLRRQREFHAIRLRVARRYQERLTEARYRIVLQEGCVHPDHARHLFVVQLPVEHMRRNRDETLFALRARNIGASIHYSPLHRMPLYRNLRKPVKLVRTEQVTERILTLPISATISIPDVDYVCDNLLELVS
jgi:dTDP-4-amino-4,6-dideoxygalactose transaminase